MVSSLVGVCSFTWTVCPYCLPPQHFGFGLGNSFTFCLGAMVLTRMKPSPEEREKVTSAILKRSRKLKKDQGPEKTQRCLSQPGLQIGRSLTKTHGLINRCGEQVRWWKWTMLCFVYSMFSKGIHRAACWIVLVCSPLPCSCDLSCGLLQRLTHPGFYSSWCPWSCWATGPWRWTWTQLSILLVGWLCLVLYVHAYLCAFAFQ